MNFSEITIALHGEAGRQWLDALPDLLTHYAERWDLTIEAPFDNLSYNYVTPARRADGTLVVLKVGVPHDELRTEIAALRHFNGRGSVRLLEADAENCAMLLERIAPGETLWNVEDEIATEYLLDVMPQLWQPYHGDYPFKSVADWGRGFARLRKRHHGTTGKLDKRIVEKAEKIFFELLSSSAESVLLHGDLHHANVLLSDDSAIGMHLRRPVPERVRSPILGEIASSGYASTGSTISPPRKYISCLAIDPKGVLGEPCYEVGAFLRNPLPGLLKKENPPRLMQRRVDRIVERFGFDRQRVLGWGFAQAVLSAIWCDEDGVDCGERAMRVAGILEGTW